MGSCEGKRVDSLAVSVVASQSTSKKQSSQMSIGFQGPSCHQPGQLEQYTKVGNLGEPAQLQQLLARACASDDSENSSSQSNGSQEEVV